MRKRICDAAIEVLLETGMPAVMWGDSGLLHMIAERANLKSAKQSWVTEDRVLSALSRQPGKLIPGITTAHGNRKVRIFWIPEHAPDYAIKRHSDKFD